jgi:hypothetical protein
MFIDGPNRELYEPNGVASDIGQASHGPSTTARVELMSWRRVGRQRNVSQRITATAAGDWIRR